jgi:hypothetical protein
MTLQIQFFDKGTAVYFDLKRLQTLAGLEPGISCSGGVRDDHSARKTVISNIAFLEVANCFPSSGRTYKNTNYNIDPRGIWSHYLYMYINSKFFQVAEYRCCYYIPLGRTYYVLLKQKNRSFSESQNEEMKISTADF